MTKLLLEAPALYSRPERRQGLSVSLELVARGGLCRYVDGGVFFTLWAERHRLGHPTQMQSAATLSELLTAWPQLENLITLLGCDEDGVPRDALEQAWYWMSGAMPERGGERWHTGKVLDKHNDAECLAGAQAILHCDWETVAKLQTWLVWQAREGADGTVAEGELLPSEYNWSAAKAALGQWIAEQDGVWKQQSRACIRQHSLQVYGPVLSTAFH